jgi:predicted transcriptional regulator
MAAAVAAVVPVGLALSRMVTCVADDLPLQQAARRVPTDPGAIGVPVVDERGVLVGLLPRASVALVAITSSNVVVADRMIPPGTAVNEGDTLGEAFRGMCSRRARELVVVASTGEVVGLLRDVDAMRFVASVSRRGLVRREDDAA